MSERSASVESPSLYREEAMVDGHPREVESLDLLGQRFSLRRGVCSILSLDDEWYEDVHDPKAVVAALKETRGFKPDLYTFWQRLPDTKPSYDYYLELEKLAVLPVESYDHWFRNRLKSRVRNLIRKSEKKGVEVRLTEFDDQFVEGMTAIFNEAPIRQGRRFWHYGKDARTIKEQFSRFIHREQMIGAYLGDEMIGFMMLGDAGRFALTGQIISAIKHRDKATNNLLIAKAVEVCEQRHLPYLCYLFWSNDSLAEFKRRCGFEQVEVPRYFVPLTARGKLVLDLGLHRGIRAALPTSLKEKLKKARTCWLEVRHKQLGR